MTGADLIRLPATTKPGAGASNVKKNESNNNSNFESIMMSMGTSNLRTLDISKSSESLKSVSSNKTQVQVNLKVEVKEQSFETSNVNTKETNTIESKVSTLDTETVDEIKNMISEDLGISDEEIVNAMEILGLNFVDLLDPKNMMLLVGEITTDADPASLLMVDGMKELISDLKDLVNGLDLSNFETVNPEESAQIMQNFSIDNPEETEVPELNVVTTEEIEPKAVEDTDVSDETEATDAVKVEVLDYRSEVEKSGRTTFREDAEAESITGIENDFVSKVLEPSDDKGGSFDAKDNLFSKNDMSKQTKADVKADANPVSFNLNAEASEIEVVDANQSVSKVSVTNMIDTIVERARVTLTDSVKTMEMVLNPEELGKVFMEVTAKDGAVKAKLLAQNETVKAALETQLVILQDRFKEAGMKVDSVEISVGTHEFREGQEESAALDMNMGNSESNGKSQEEMQESKPRLHRIDLNNMDNLMGLMTDEEVLAAQIMKQQGNTISFQA
jgi:flagellar hook-length control protein FliK